MPDRAPMPLPEAIASILGTEAAAAITLDMGEHWALVAAVKYAKTTDDPRALSAIDQWLAEQKKERSGD